MQTASKEVKIYRKKRLSGTDTIFYIVNTIFLIVSSRPKRCRGGQENEHREQIRLPARRIPICRMHPLRPAFQFLPWRKRSGSSLV